MDGVTVREYGLRFVWECLKKYLGGSWPFAVIFAAGIIICIAAYFRSRKKAAPLDVVTLHADSGIPGPGNTENVPDYGDISATWLFLSVILMCAATVCNPFFVRALVPKMGMTAVYYRFFWVLPLTAGSAYYLVKALSKFRKRLVRALAFVITAGALTFVIPLNPGIRSFRVPTNVYKVDGAIPVICEAVHEDYENSAQFQEAEENLQKITDKKSKKWMRAVQRTYPVCVFPSQLEFAVRQYDPTIRLLFNRNLRLYYEGNRSTGITYGETNKRYQRRALILDAMYGRDKSITVDEFRTAMEKTKTRYLIAEDNLADADFLTQAGCSLAAQEAGYYIFRYDG